MFLPDAPEASPSWPRSPYPNGDHPILLAEDFTHGTFGHPLGALTPLVRREPAGGDRMDCSSFKPGRQNEAAKLSEELDAARKDDTKRSAALASITGLANAAGSGFDAVQKALQLFGHLT